MPTVGQLGLDANGYGESCVAAWDFKNMPEIAEGLSLLGSPAPTLEIVTPSGQPSITVGALVVVGTQVQALVGVTGGTAGLRYNTVCRGYFSAEVWRYVYGDILLIGPS